MSSSNQDSNGGSDVGRIMTGSFRYCVCSVCSVNWILIQIKEGSVESVAVCDKCNEATRLSKTHVEIKSTNKSSSSENNVEGESSSNCNTSTFPYNKEDVQENNETRQTSSVELPASNNLRQLAESIMSSLDNKTVISLDNISDIPFSQDTSEVGYIQDTDEVGYIQDTGELDCIQDTDELGCIQDTGELGCIQDTDELGCIQDTGELACIQDTDELGCIQDTGELACIQDTDKLGCIQDTGELGCIQDTDELGCIQDTGKLGCIQDTDELGCTQDTGELDCIYPTMCIASIVNFPNGTISESVAEDCPKMDQFYVDDEISFKCVDKELTLITRDVIPETAQTTGMIEEMIVDCNENELVSVKICREDDVSTEDTITSSLLRTTDTLENLPKIEPDTFLSRTTNTASRSEEVNVNTVECPLAPDKGKSREINDEPDSDNPSDDDLSKTNIQCSICDQRFARRSELMEHERLHRPDPSEKCGICHALCETQLLLQQHYHSEHRDRSSQLFNCSFCFYTTNRVLDFIRHVRLHTGEKPYVCTHCGRRCIDKRALKRHIESLHISNESKEAVSAQHVSLVSKSKTPKRTSFLETAVVPPSITVSNPEECSLSVKLENESSSAIDDDSVHDNPSDDHLSETNIEVQYTDVYLMYCTPDLILSRVDDLCNIDKPCCHQCRICPKIFRHVSALARHERTHTDTLPYVGRLRERIRAVFTEACSDGDDSDWEDNVTEACSDGDNSDWEDIVPVSREHCYKELDSSHQLTRHVQQAHGNVTTAQQTVIDDISRAEDKHLETPSGQPTAFLSGAKIFQSASVLEAEELQRAGSASKPAAHHSFDVYSDVSQHPTPLTRLVQQAHSNATTAQQTVNDGISGVQDEQLEISARYPLTHACSICFQRFAGQIEMMKHQRLHRPDPCERCGICQEICDTAFLLEHYKSKHRDKSSQLFRCNLCLFTSKDAGDFVGHVRVHTGEKPYVCTICENRFISERKLSAHVLFEHPENLQPYSCTRCRKLFYQFEAFQLHWKTHEKEDTYTFASNVSSCNTTVHSSNAQIVDASNAQIVDASNAQIGDASNVQIGDASNAQIGDASNALIGDVCQLSTTSNERLPLVCPAAHLASIIAQQNHSSHSNNHQASVSQHVTLKSISVSQTLVEQTTVIIPAKPLNVVKSSVVACLLQPVQTISRPLRSQQSLVTSQAMPLQSVLNHAVSKSTAVSQLTVSAPPAASQLTVSAPPAVSQLTVSAPQAVSQLIVSAPQAVPATQHVCSYCFQQFADKIELMRHEQLHRPDSHVKCGICPETFVTELILRNHYIYRHRDTSSQLFTCNFCAHTTKEVRSFVNHVRLHTGEKPYVCTQCDTRWFNEQTLSRHIKSAHQGKRRDKCPQCGKVFYEIEAFKLHRQMHGDERPYACTQCDKKYMYSKFLDEHIKRFHNKILKYICAECGKSHRDSGKLNIHMMVQHGKERVHLCTVCGKKFATNSILKKHLLGHTENRSFVCSQCSKGFSTELRLSTHVKNVHGIKRRYVCAHCGKVYKSKERKKLHEVTHTGVPRYACKHCDKLFFFSKCLDLHVIEMHVGEGKYKCNHCGVVLSKATSLKRHIGQMHDVGERDEFKCDHCGMVLTQKQSLMRHIRLMHDNECPYVCAECKRRFSEGALLKIHLLTHQ